MADRSTTLAVVALPGLAPDSLGYYLASLGLLRILARRWPRIRGAWRNGVFHLVGGPENLDQLLDALTASAEGRTWTPYERGWGDAQKKSTGAKSGVALALWEASAPETELELLAAHAVPAARVSFNPMLGSGGNAGRRDFAKGWKAAIDALAPSTGVKASTRAKKSTPSGAETTAEQRTKRDHLRALLLGEPVTWMLEQLNAASWFSEANKLYNSGQRPFREGGVSPWAMALACEGLTFFAGGSSRRLGARARAVGAFPFVTHASAPRASGEAGRDQAEVWAPLWDRPMTAREAQALFARGRAEVGGRGALTPGAFATAILRRGIDAGITEFRRFVLGRTTSANTFEPRFEGAVHVRDADDKAVSGAAAATAPSIAFERMLALVDRLPSDRVRGRWRFVGLRGPLEAAMLRAVAEPTNPDAACSILDATVSALDRVDRNRAFRERQIAWQPLPVAWVPALFGGEAPGVEARLALACVSAFPVEYPFARYRFGVEIERRRLVHAQRPPAQWVWRPGRLAAVLSEIVHRRALDWEAERDHIEPVRFQMPVSSEHVERWLNGLADDDLIARWLSRLALFDWRSVPRSVGSLATKATERQTLSGSLCLYGLFAPLLDSQPVFREESFGRANLLTRESGARTPAAARILVNLLRDHQVDSAVRLAGGRYAMAGAALVRGSVPWDVQDSVRLIASLLFPVFHAERAALVERWLRPRRAKGELPHG